MPFIGVIFDLGPRAHGVPARDVEMSLAHIEDQGHAVARACNHSDAIEKRRALMQVWGVMGHGRVNANVVPSAASART